MIKKYTYGKPFNTEAVVLELSAEKGNLQYFTFAQKNEQIDLEYKLGDDDIIYGLGEAVRGINKRGWIYKSFNTDDDKHLESKHSLYGSHNFFVVDGHDKFGVFVDFPGLVSFDMGCTESDKLKVTVFGGDTDVYIIDGGSVLDIVKQFRVLEGQSYVPPLWAFGYQQSRWSYGNAEEVNELVRNFRENGMPLDAVYLDIDYMKDYKDFTIDEEKFPNFSELNSELKKDGVRLVPIIDAGVKIEDGYDVYEEGVQNDYFCKREDGSDFVAGVWPGRTHFPDFLNEKARKWFGDKYKRLTDMGVEGFWNDMNEPAIFYSDESLEEAFKIIESTDRTKLGVNELWRLLGAVENIKNSPEDYKRFFHNTAKTFIRHDYLHNLYGYNMTRAAGEAFDRIAPNKRMLLFSRSSYIGSHRYGGIWTGDNSSWWSHLLLNIKMMPSLNMCGYIYSGADIGGFNCDTTEDLLLRWLEFGVFSPLLRNHSCIGTSRQEPFAFKRKALFRNVMLLRYRLLPFIYTEYMNAVLSNDMYFKPLGFVFPNDEAARRTEDQLLVGDSIMIAPIYEQNARGRYVYLPEDMLFVQLNAKGELSFDLMKKGRGYINQGLGEAAFFIRKNRIIPMAEPALSVKKLNVNRLNFVGYVENGEKVCYNLYIDDGFSKDYKNPSNRVAVTVERKPDGETSIFSERGDISVTADIY